MYTRFRKWLQTTPALTDPVQQQQAPMLQMIIFGLSMLEIILIIINIVVDRNIISTSIMLLCFVLTIMSLFLLRRGYFNTAVSFVITLNLMSNANTMLFTSYRDHWMVFFSLSIPIILSGLLGTRRMLWLTLGFCTVLLAIVTGIGLYTPALKTPSSIAISTFIVFIIMLSFIGMCFDRFGQVLRHSVRIGLERQQELEQVRAQQEQVIDERTSELRSSLSLVEQRERELAKTLSDLQASKAMLSAVSAPTIPVMPGVLLVPVIGNLDSQRADSLTSNTLLAVEQEHCHAVIFDITGVEVVDTQVAQVLVRTASAAQLLGARVMMVGIRPEVAQTMVTLGIDLRTFSTYNNLHSALTMLRQQ